MKSIYLLLVLVLLCVISCSDDFLEKQPLGIPSENYFQNEKGINAMLIGTFSLVQGSSLWDVGWGASIQNWVFGSGASDDAYLAAEFTGSSSIYDNERWKVRPTNDFVEDKWKWAINMGVFRANEVLRLIYKTELKEEIRTEFIAEARFLRALFYFEAWLVFGDYVPIIDKSIEYFEWVSNDNQPEEVLEFIITDLKFASENLPENQEDVGRPTKYAAMALAARAYLQELKYSDAKPLLDKIIESGKYALAQNFFDNFRIEHNNNVESIFEIQACVNDVRESLNAEMGIGLNWPHGGDIGMCCGFHQTSQNLANAFKVGKDGLPLFDMYNNFDLENDVGINSKDSFIPSEQPLDPRIDWTISRRGIPFLDWGINRGKDWVRKQEDGGPYLPAIKTFFYKYQRYTLSTSTGWMTGVNANNYRYLRYSHILLWRAEVAAYEGDLALAKELVNQIRNRAAQELVMGKVLIHKLPESVYPWGEGTSSEDYMVGGAVDWTKPAANYKVGLYTAFSDANEAMRAVQWEQRLEFATEGRRFFDLRRWDNLPNKIGGKSMDEILNEFAWSDLRIRPLIMTGASFSEKDKFQPVPQSQLELFQEFLIQRPDYVESLY